MSEAYQLPFGSDLLQSTEGEPSEPTPLLNLPENGVDNCRAHPAQASSRFGPQGIFQGADDCSRGRQSVRNQRKEGLIGPVAIRDLRRSNA
jgi:hypothetical protein